MTSSLPNAIRTAIAHGNGLSAAKRCSKCEAVKPLEAFHRAKSSKDGRHSWCVRCYNNIKLLRKTGRTERLPRQSISPGDAFERWTVVEFSHSERSRHYWKCRCSCGTERTVAASNLYAGGSKSCGCLTVEILRGRAMPSEERAIRGIIGSYRCNATIRNLIWELTYDQCAALFKQPCHYCGVAQGNETRCRGLYRYNGIDRVDNSRGYTIDNVVACCGVCNRCKNTLSRDEFIAWAKLIAERHP